MLRYKKEAVKITKSKEKQAYEAADKSIRTLLETLVQLPRRLKKGLTEEKRQ